jgi:peroxiredoxin
MDSMIKVGDNPPLFHLQDLRGNLHTKDDFNGWIGVLYFWSAECSWCERVDRELSTYMSMWKDQVKVFWIASNVNEPGELIDTVAHDRNIPTVLIDNHQVLADLYGAQTTPHFFVVDGKGVLRYQGAWDDITFRQREARQVYLPKVIDALRQNLAPDFTQTPAYGCTLVRFPE